MIGRDCRQLERSLLIEIACNTFLNLPLFFPLQYTQMFLCSLLKRSLARLTETCPSHTTSTRNRTCLFIELCVQKHFHCSFFRVTSLQILMITWAHAVLPQYTNTEKLNKFRQRRAMLTLHGHQNIGVVLTRPV